MGYRSSPMFALVMVVAMAMMSTHVNGAINPTPSVYSLPLDGIVSIGFARNTTTLIVATSSSNIFAIYSGPSGSSDMKLISSINFTGDYRCLIAGGEHYQFSVLTYSSSTKLPSSFVYHFNEPDGRIIADSVTQFPMPDPIGYSSLSCSPEPFDRPTSKGVVNGYYIASASSRLYFLSKPLPSSPSTFTLASQLMGGPYNTSEVMVVPGIQVTSYQPIALIVRVDSSTPLVFQYELPNPGIVVNMIGANRDEVGPLYVTLARDARNPFRGFMIATLKYDGSGTSGGVSALPFDFASFAPVGDKGIDRNTIYNAKQPLIVQVYGNCMYVIGSHRDTSSDTNIIAFTQWRVSSPPAVVDQARLKIPATSTIVDMKVGWLGYTYIADSQRNIYRFQTQCN